MSGLYSSEENPIVNFNSDLAGFQWRNGGGTPVYVDMYSLFASGAASSIIIDDFAGLIEQDFRG